jgi:hypothetical protein
MVLRNYRGVMLGLAVIVALSFSGRSVWAAEECVAVSNASASVDKFLDEVKAAHSAGQGTLPINDVLIGVTQISTQHQQDLDARERVQLTTRDANGGDYVNRGPQRITVEGVVADSDTLFRLPELIMGRYVLGPDSVTLLYDPKHTIEVGMSVLGIHFFKAMNRTIFTKKKLSFFFAGNDGDEPDRCYDVLQN